MEQKELELKYEPWLLAAQELIRFDEVERALTLLNQLPAIYRDNPIAEIETLKTKIKRALVTPHAYMSAALDQDVDPEHAQRNIRWLLRGRILEEEIKQLNAQGKTPHLVDVGPGEYWAPLGLDAWGYKFSYKAVAMDRVAALKAEEHLAKITDKRKDGEPTVFIAQEIIEHLPSPQDLVTEALRYCDGWPDYVHISTPCYTFSCGPKDWDKLCGLPHLRAYTPTEFVREVTTLFPGYKWEFKTDAIQSLRGYKTGEGIVANVADTPQ